MLNDITPRETLRILRDRAGLTQEEAAAKLGSVSRSLLAAIETGRVLPGAETADAIEREFGIPAAAWTNAKPEPIEAAS